MSREFSPGILAVMKGLELTFTVMGIISYISRAVCYHVGLPYQWIEILIVVVGISSIISLYHGIGCMNQLSMIFYVFMKPFLLMLQCKLLMNVLSAIAWDIIEQSKEYTDCPKHYVTWIQNQNVKNLTNRAMYAGHLICWMISGIVGIVLGVNFINYLAARNSIVQSRQVRAPAGGTGPASRGAPTPNKEGEKKTEQKTQPPPPPYEA